MGAARLAPHQKKGLRIGASLGFLDESGVSERPTVCRSWAPKGQTPIIRSTGSWKVRSVIGVLRCTPNGRRIRLFLRIFHGTIRSSQTVRFLKELRHHVQGKIILLWDGWAPHHSKHTRLFLAAQKHWISVERFPAYAPELNPVEYFWSAMKRRDLGNVCAESLTDLDGRIRRSGRRVRRQQGVLHGFLKASGLFRNKLST